MVKRTVPLITAFMVLLCVYELYTPVNATEETTTPRYLFLTSGGSQVHNHWTHELPVTRLPGSVWENGSWTVENVRFNYYIIDTQMKQVHMLYTETTGDNRRFALVFNSWQRDTDGHPHPVNAYFYNGLQLPERES